ncbi:MAG: Hin recombinase [Thermoplasmatales archaeon]|nr:Hin recombinase [Thermoplasmatales archaeon]
MTRRKKLTKEDCEHIAKLINEGHEVKDLADKYNVHRSTIYNRCKYLYQSKKIPIETRNKVVKAIKEGHTKAEAAQLCGLNIGTVYNLTRGIEGYRSQGNHIIRKNGIKLLCRLMSDGYLISDFNVQVVRILQHKFPIIRTARYKNKTFFYLPGREEQTIEAFFKEKPDRIISYSAIEELSYLLGIKISNKDQCKLLDRFNKKHEDYCSSRRLIQRSIDDWIDDEASDYVGESFRLMQKQ